MCAVHDRCFDPAEGNLERCREHSARITCNDRFSRTGADPAEAVGSVDGLHAIADGATLAHALDKLGVDDPDIAQAVKALCQSTIGEDERRVPSQQQRQDARDQLHGFHLSRAWLRPDRD